MNPESLIADFVKGSAFAAGMFIVLIAGSKGKWLWPREFAFQREMFERIINNLQERLVDQKAETAEWKSIGMEAVQAAKKTAAAAAVLTKSEQG
jgi:hypothetical protein